MPPNLACAGPGRPKCFADCGVEIAPQRARLPSLPHWTGNARLPSAQLPAEHPMKPWNLAALVALALTVLAGWSAPAQAQCSA